MYQGQPWKKQQENAKFFSVLLQIIIVKNWQRIQENWLSTHIMMKLMYMYIAFSPLPFGNYISQVTTLVF